MEPDVNPFRRILRTTLVMGSASFANLLVGIVRTKMLAVLLGPSGLGLMALYNSVMASANALFGAGLGFSGVKHLAQTEADSEAFFRARAALWYASLGLGMLAAGLLWLFSAQVSEWVLGDRSHASEVAWVGLGVIFSLLASSQTAVLQGQRRIPELAKVQVISAILSSAAAVLLVLWLKSAGIVLAVLAGPVVGTLVGFAYVGRTPGASRFGKWREHASEFRLMLNLGLMFMLNSIVSQLSEVWVRASIGRELGLEAVGHYQAAWVISQNYLGIVLAALTTEFFPRLAEAVRKRESVAQLVDEQIGAAFVMTAPLILVTMAFAPMIVPLLFSEAFTGTMPVLRWQLFGDVLRVATVPLIYVLAAHERKFLYLLIPTLWHVVYIFGILLWTPRFGLEGAGFAYVLSHTVYFVAACWAVWAATGVRIGYSTLLIGGAALSLAIITRVALDGGSILGMVVGGASALGWIALFAFRVSRR